MCDLEDDGQRMAKEFGTIQHLFECIRAGTVTVVEGDVFDAEHGRYGHRQILAFIAEHSLAGLGLPFPDLPKNYGGKEEERHERYYDFS